MGQGVRIGMSQQPQVKGDGHPAQHQGPACHQPVGILPIAQTRGGGGEQGGKQGDILGDGELLIGQVPGAEGHGAV